MRVPKRRRREGKTDYKLRMGLLKSGKPRVVFRKTNSYIIGGYVESKEAKDKVVVNAVSKELLSYGWPESSRGSLKSLPASYLTGFLLGKKILDKINKKGKAEGVFDIGLLRSIKKSRVYAFLKGIRDSGVKITGKEELFPDEKRIKGEHLKIKLEIEKIKENIEKRFV